MRPKVKKCAGCRRVRDISKYYFNKTANIYYAVCKSCHLARCKIYAQSDPRYRLWISSKTRSIILRRKGKKVSHTIRIEDIELVEFCPYLGVKLDYTPPSERGSKRHKYIPSIDRIDPEKGYIPGNIQIISDLANRMKSDSTIEQLLLFARGVIKLHGRK